jgi:FkbM family methyltransferase
VEFSGLEGHLLNQLCADGNIVVEVGANIGAHTVWLVRTVGNSGRVLAFEPQTLVHQVLCANVGLNSLENVECYWVTVSRENGVIIVPEVSPHESCNFGGVGLEEANSGLNQRSFP